MSYSYATAKSLLSETEKNRLLSLYLSTDEPNVDWEKATTAFGAASVSSMKKMVQNSLKKIADAGGKNGVTAASSVPETAVETPKKQGGKGRKRKAEDTVVESDDEDGTDTPKSLRKKVVKNVKREVDDDDDGDEDGVAKTPKTPKIPKTPKGGRKTKTVKKEEVEDDDEDVRDNINVASKKTTQEDEGDEEV